MPHQKDAASNAHPQQQRAASSKNTHTHTVCALPHMHMPLRRPSRICRHHHTHTQTRTAAASPSTTITTHIHARQRRQQQRRDFPCPCLAPIRSTFPRILPVLIVSSHSCIKHKCYPVWTTWRSHQNNQPTKSGLTGGFPAIKIQNL